MKFLSSYIRVLRGHSQKSPTVFAFCTFLKQNTHLLTTNHREFSTYHQFSFLQRKIYPHTRQRFQIPVYKDEARRILWRLSWTISSDARVWHYCFRVSQIQLLPFLLMTILVDPGDSMNLVTAAGNNSVSNFALLQCIRPQMKGGLASKSE